jgi:type VI secretion system protein ImpB
MRVAGQKYIGRNRPPRVQIEVDVEGADGPKSISIPFVLGVMADLSGASASELPDVGERKTVDIDGETFDQVLQKARPRVRFAVANAITGQGGDLPVEITFENLDDFSPDAIAQKVEPMRKLLEARKQLENLKLWMDNDKGALNALDTLFEDRAQLNALLSGAPPTTDKPEA